jgi:hypothetical protein
MTMKDYGGPHGPSRIPPYHGSGGDCPGLGGFTLLITTSRTNGSKAT